MKLNDLQQLDEISLKQAAAAGALGLATLSTPAETPHRPSGLAAAGQVRHIHPRINTMFHETAAEIAERYRIDRKRAYEIVALAHKHADPTFPTAHDILSVIGIESSFNPHAVSSLKRDPARGLMQVRPGVWGIETAELQDIEKQIKYGVDILKGYHNLLKNKWKTLHAYNVGLTKFRKGKRNPEYIEKFKKEHTLHAM